MSRIWFSNIIKMIALVLSFILLMAGKVDYAIYFVLLCIFFVLLDILAVQK